MNERIVLGFGNNIDYEMVWDSSVFESLIIQYDIHRAELNINQPINSERDFVISILGFLQGGFGGERFVASSEIIEQLVQKFEYKITLGGTSVRAAIAMRKLGYTSALHLVTINDHVRSLIPQDSPYVCSNENDISYPHLIVQFGIKTCVKANDIDICTSQANRLIYHSDHDNIIMNLNEDFADLITDAKIMLVSGFNAMQSEELLTKRLKTVLGFMEKLPEDALIFYEEAGFYEPKFCQLIYQTLDGHIDIVSLNEDEMQTHLNRPLDLLSVAQIKEALAALQNIIPMPVIVVHTKHWALAYGENVARFAKALKAGVTMATTRFCYGDDFTVENYNAIEQLTPHQDHAIFADAINRLPGDTIICVPVAQVDQSTGTTVGLGDTFVAGFVSAAITE